MSPVNPSSYLLRKLVSVSPAQMRFDARGFEGGSAQARACIEQLGGAIALGCHFALVETRPEPLARMLSAIEAKQRGFAYEGVGMALVLQDLLTPWPGKRFAAFLQGPGDAHAYMLHAGAGWALARLPRRVEPNLKHFDPLLRWLVLDGYGFHQGYFHWQRYITRRQQPSGLSTPARSIFDQGLGRSLWFVKGADTQLIVEALQVFSEQRQANLWAGVGFAAAYAGGVDEAALRIIRRRANGYRPQLAQGVAFAAKVRVRASNPAPHTELASRVLCGMPASDAAATTDACLKGLDINGEQAAYEIWRQRIARHFQAA